MKTHVMRGWLTSVLVFAVVGWSGCGRRTRGNGDAAERNRAATPAEGGATSTAHSAGQSKDFGDTQAKKEFDTASPAGKSHIGTGSTGGPGAREKKEVTIQPESGTPTR